VGGEGGLRIQVLGRVRGWRDGVELDLGPARRRAVFGLLVLAAGRPVTRGEMIGSLWGEQAPPSAVNVIHTHVKHLRRIVDPQRQPWSASAVLPSVGDGYALNAAADAVDLARFRELNTTAAEALRAGDSRRAAALFDQAMHLWQGTPLADLTFLVDHPKVVALVAERQAALAQYAQAMVDIGAAAEVLPALEEAAVAQPLDEVVHAWLMLAYHAVGRRAKAFEVYATIRARLADELGIDPGPELASAHRAVLVEAQPEDQPDALQVATHPIPAQLPADNAGFVGRASYLERLDEYLPQERGSPTTVVTVSGTAGVGKTTLVVHWAHRVADRFPDGQLYADLRGFGPTGLTRTTAETVRGFLDAFAVPTERIPVSVEAQLALYRSLLAGKQILVVLDNALDADHVRPLLPGSPGCLAIVTSRDRLTGLVATAGAHPLVLGMLSRAEAHELLARRLGRARVLAEASAVEDLIACCARLPLALAVVAAQAAVQPRRTLTAIVRKLRATPGGLDALTDHDPSTDVRPAFSWSYQTLGPSAARLFRLLGLHSGPDVAPEAAASLAGVSIVDADAALAELCRAQLVVEHTPGRFTTHDLLRAYAAELACHHDSDGDRAGALGRVLDHYLHTALDADRLLFPHRDRIAPPDARPGVVGVKLSSHADAMSWFTGEHATLLAAVRRAHAAGFDTHAWQLASAMDTYLLWRGHWQDQLANHSLGLDAATRSADAAGQAYAHRRLGRTYHALGEPATALAHCRRALDLFGELGDQAGQAHTHVGFGMVYERDGLHAAALSHTEQALQLFRLAGHVAGQASTLNNLGWCHAQLGEFESALACCQEALALQQEMGDRDGEAATWDSLAYAQHRLGRYDDAIRCYQRAIEQRRELGDRYYEARSLVGLGEAYEESGDLAGARDVRERALTILEELRHSDADQVRAKLSRTPPAELEPDAAAVPFSAGDGQA
jgi:DNA-binding SARP family transcriptional activator/Tfp pilus assembly protein PilF